MPAGLAGGGASQPPSRALVLVAKQLRPSRHLSAPAFPGSLAHGIESLAVNSTNDEAFTFNATGGYVLCSHLGAEPKPTGGTPAALLAAVREFNISCDRNDADGALVDIYYPLALVTCPANCSTASARVYGRQACLYKGAGASASLPC